MIPTPDLRHLTSEDYIHVYQPAEDTFLLLDALEQDAHQLANVSTCLEVGSGSGCVSTFVATFIGSSAIYLCTDINPHACLCTLRTGLQNKVILDPIQTSFADPFLSRLHHSIDLIIFNPPYVPTVSSEASDAQDTTDIEGSWAGGLDGMQVTNRFLTIVDQLLSPEGRFYLVAVKENNIPEIQSRMSLSYGLQSSIVLSRRAGREHLSILRFARTPIDIT